MTSASVGKDVGAFGAGVELMAGKRIRGEVVFKRILSNGHGLNHPTIYSWSRPGRVPHTADNIVDADHVALRAAAVRKRGGIAGLGIAALRARAVNIEQLVVA